MTDHYRQALEGLRERCAQEVERITARRRVLTSIINNEAVKPCKIAAAIRKIDVQQYYEGAAREIERLRARVAELERDLDACRVDHAEAYEQGRRDALREAIDLCQRTEAGDTNHDWREAAKCCRELIESLAAQAAEEAAR